MGTTKAEDIKSIFNVISNLNGSRYGIRNLTAQYPSSSVRIAHLILVKSNVVRRNGSVYEILNKEELEHMCKYSTRRIESIIKRMFKSLNKTSSTKSRYKGRNAPLDMFRDIQDLVKVKSK